MAFSLRSTLMFLLFLAPLLCSFHSCLASRLFPEPKVSSATELGLDSSSLLPTLQNHMLIPNPNPALPTFQDHMPFPNPNPALPPPTFKDNIRMPNPNPAFSAFPFPGLPALPKLPPMPPMPKFPFIPITIPPYNPFLHPIPPIPGSAKHSADLEVSTNEPITTTP